MGALYPPPSLGAGADTSDIVLLKVLRGHQMSKGDKKRGNREAKKPKKVKEKVIAAASSNKGSTSPILGQKKKK